MHKSLLFTFFLFGFTAIGSAQTGKAANLDSLITEALRNNPRILAAREESAAAYTRIQQSTSFDPPQVGIELFQTPISSFPNPVKNGQETDYSIQQMFPYPGKRAAMGNVARNGAAMTDRNIGAIKRQVIREMKSAYYAMYLADRTLGINTQNQDLMRELLAVASRQYEVGTGKQADILKAQTELSMLALSAINLQREKKVEEARVNTIAGRPAGDSLGEVEDIEKDIPAWTVNQFDSLALGNRPELKAMDYNIRMKEAELAVSQKERMPDFMVRLMYKDMVMGGTDYWSTMFGFTLPQSFWSRGKVRSKIEESRINIRKAQAEWGNMKNEVFLQVHEAYVNVESNRRSIEYCWNTLIPQAEQTLQISMDGYRAVTVDFLTVIDAARMLLQVRQEHEVAIVNYMQSQADLEQAVGMDSDKIAQKIHQ
ncbi:MAG: TolC family protein [Candidatus Latescibacter sp.]|nr:TolC family protein [Candidatus Latescibacter sp.]